MTRREKILQRTRVGLTLAAVVGLLLWGASTSIGAPLTLGIAVTLTLWCVAEIDRMALFRSGFAPFGAAAACLVGAGLFFYADFRPSVETGQIATWLFLVALIAGFVGILVATFGGTTEPVSGPEPDAPDALTGSGKVRAGVALPNLVIVPLIGLPLLYLYPIRSLGGGGALACFVVLAKIGDIAGYYFGNLMGKTHPFPRLSPGKTVAGCVASLIAGTLVGGLFVLMGALDGARLGVLSGLLLGALVNVSAQAGDLMESGLKRRADVKDSGTTFGPSGGMLDLVDSFLLAAPLAAFAWPLLFTS